MEHRERAFWYSISDVMPGFTQRIETSTSPGVPDVYCCFRGLGFWIELKVWTPGVGILIRKEQYAWANKHSKSQGKWFLLCALPDATEKNVSALLSFDSIYGKVEPYGTSEKYVVLRKMPESHVVMVGKKAIANTLIKKLFT